MIAIPGIYVKVFFLVAARLAGLFMTAPIFNSKTFSSRIKIGLIFWITVSIMFVVPVPQTLPDFSFYFLIILLNDFLLGVLIGFMANVIFAGVQFAGSLMDMQMGMSVAQTFDPMAGSQVTIMERLMQYLCIILFLDVKGHHLLLGSVYESFKMFPVASIIQLGNSYQSIVEMAKLVFFIGVQVSAPIVLVIFLLDFSFGVISRVAPQVNVFQLGFQMKPTLGAFVFILLLPLLTDRVVEFLIQMNDNILKLFVLLQGPAGRGF